MNLAFSGPCPRSSIKTKLILVPFWCLWSRNGDLSLEIIILRAKVDDSPKMVGFSGKSPFLHQKHLKSTKMRQVLILLRAQVQKQCGFPRITPFQWKHCYFIVI